MFRPTLLSKRSVTLVAALLAMAAPAAHGASAKTVMFNVNGGVSLPTGDFGDANLFDAKTGFQVGGSVDYMVTEMIAIGVDGSYNRNKSGREGDVLDLGGGDTGKVDKDKFTTIQFGAHAKWMFPVQGGPIGPYALIGLGAYNGKEEFTETTTTIGGTPTTSSGEFKYDTRFGGKLGLGAVYKATEQVGIGIEGDYNFISEDKAKTGGTSSLQYVGIHGGVTFHILPK